uniref:hypothetical protein n=1 Tax=Alistipes sp. TaxID=1872444 RepID=UPI0040562F2E
MTPKRVFEYELQEVCDRRSEQEFLDVVERIYAGNPYYVRPFDGSIRGIFDPKRNKMFRGGEAQRWIARRVSTGEIVGRIAAFYNREQAALEEQPTGGCGFFESIEDYDVAYMLFDRAQEWLKERGMEAMDGPINFGPRDAFWGLLVENFECEPLFENPYNPPYYKAFFEQYGFQNYFNQHTYLRELREGLFSDSVYERVKRLKENPSYRFSHISKQHLDRVIEEFRTIYNKAWAGFSGVKEMSKEEARGMLNMLRPILDEKLVYFAHYDKEPIGFFIMIPDLNRLIGDFHGRFGWWQKLKLFWRLKFTRKADRVFGLIFGVAPEFHGKGIESGMIHAFEQEVAKLPYKRLELAWIGDFNPVMMRMVEGYVCATRHKMHTTYRLLFDREKPFKRCPRLGRKRGE